MIAKSVLALLLLCAASPAASLHAQSSDPEAEREARHQSAEWLLMEPHLPDQETGSPAALQLAADVLRARRMPEDALEYYRSALKRGGSPTVLMNRIGVTELEWRLNT